VSGEGPPRSDDIPHQCQTPTPGPVDYDEMEHCNEVALFALGGTSLAERHPMQVRRLAGLLVAERDAAWAEGKVDGRREAEKDHADYVKERAELVRVLGVEGDQTLVDAANWNAAEARVPDGFLKAADELAEVIEACGYEDVDLRAALDRFHEKRGLR
jgi:hypothetical protein